MVCTIYIILLTWDLGLTISTHSALLLIPSSVCVPVQSHTTGRAGYLVSLMNPAVTLGLST